VTAKQLWPWAVIVALLAGMAGLMGAAARDESATVDEPLNLATGYLFATGHSRQFNPEHPPLGQMLTALPWLALDVNLSPRLLAVAHLEESPPWVRPWKGPAVSMAEAIYPGGSTSWYYWPFMEGGFLGQGILYHSENDADRLLLAGRVVQIGLTLLTGLVIALWLRRVASMTAAAIGVALWAFNPVALAHGHLTTTDISVTLTMTLAVWAFTMLLEKPGWRTATLTGVAVGLAMVTKFSAVLLAPMFFVLAVWRRSVWRWLPVVAGMAWVVVLLVYLPEWKPAPPLPAEAAARVGVPGWFQALRPILIPAEFFKGIALQAQHSAEGHEAFLAGEWRKTGWWYYFPLALLWKLPVPWLILTGIALILFIRRYRQWTLAEVAPWLTAGVFFGIALTSSINIGIRYLLPIFPLLAVGAAWQLSRYPLIPAAGCVWLAVVMALAHPHYLEYCNEFIGGTRNGYRYLVDSNYDWGQDAKRLARWNTDRGQPPFELRFFGGLSVVRYYGVTAPRASSTNRSGLLVISATELMGPEWDWLRAEHTPRERITHTLFLYDLTVPASSPATPSSAR
jgi:4-amino-4-deoxy-L-arabinose transferase-like glycosyltransferase